MQPSPPRTAQLLGVDTVLTRGMKVLQREDVARRLSRAQSPVARTFLRAARTFQVRDLRKSTMAYRDCGNNEETDDSKERHHHGVRDDLVEIGIADLKGP